jgi:hypothetical protein
MVDHQKVSFNIYTLDLLVINKRGVCGLVVKVVDFKTIAPHRGFESRQGLWILSCQEVIQLAY